MNRTNIFIPEKIRVGFRSREGTYTGQLAYVIYFGPDGKIRKEKSWEQWRQKDIDYVDYENVPTEGFVLNKRAGGDYTGHWGNRQMTCRTYDPRGFEYEISVDNLIWILENTDSIKGKGLVGEFVYGWDKDKLVLIPTSSPDYQEIRAYTQMVTKPTRFKARDMIVGATYATKSQPELVYLGQFERFTRNWGGSEYDYESEGVCFWFLIPNGHRGISLHTTKSLGAILRVVDDGPHSQLEWALDRIQYDDSFSPRSHVAFEPLNAKERALFLLRNGYWRYFYVREGEKYTKYRVNGYNVGPDGHEIPLREDGLPHYVRFHCEDTLSYHWRGQNAEVFKGVIPLGDFLDLPTPIYERVVYLKNGRPEKDVYSE